MCFDIYDLLKLHHVADHEFYRSATDRIEENDRRQEERMEQLMRQASHFNGENFRIRQNHYPLLLPRSSTLPRRATSSTLSGFEAVRSVP